MATANLLRSFAVAALCLVAGSATAQTPDAPAPKLLLSAYVSVVALDATTTHVALNRGARETILTQSSIANDVLLGAQAVWIAYATTRLSRQHPRIAKVLLVASIAVRGAVVANNLRVIRTMGGAR